jgi:hypothetical protein
MNSSVQIKRNWLCYVKIKDVAYCQSCWLFSDRSSLTLNSTWIDGIDDWKNISRAISIHEKSTQHINSVIYYQKTKQNLTNDYQLDKSIQCEENFLFSIL